MNNLMGFAIGHLTVIEISGADRNKILNNLCTQDLRAIQHGQVKETFILDVKGRTLSHGVVACLDSRTFFISSPGQAQRLVPHIDRYIIREDAVVRDVSEEFFAFLQPPESRWSVANHREYLGDKECSERDSDQTLCVAAAWLGQGTVLILSKAQSQDVWDCQSSDCMDRQGWELQRIESFWPWYGVDIDEKNLPQEIGINTRTISFNKGCYLGQETVARLDALGQVQKQLASVNLHIAQDGGLTSPYELVLEGKSIGFVTSAARISSTEVSGSLWAGLAMIRRGYFQPASQFLLDGGALLKVGRGL